MMSENSLAVQMEHPENYDENEFSCSITQRQDYFDGHVLLRRGC